MKAVLELLDDMFRRICLMDEEAAELFLSELDNLALMLVRLIPPYQRSLSELWEDFGSKSIQQFAEDRLRMQYEHNSQYFAYSPCINHLPATDRVRQILLKGILDKTRVIELRWDFFVTYFHTFNDELLCYIPDLEYNSDQYDSRVRESGV